MHRLTQNQLAYYQFDGLRTNNIPHGIFTRLGGVSEGQWASLNMSRSTGDAAEPVVENRKRALDALGLKQEQSITSWLVHGNHVRVLARDELRVEGANDVHADAMITRDRGLALTLRFADCVPVMFHDPAKDAVGIAHAGWKGIVNGVLMETVWAMQLMFGSRPQDIIAGVGPCIGPEKFEVGEDVATEIQGVVSVPIVERQGDTEDKERQGRYFMSSPSSSSTLSLQTKPHVNLWGAARAQLEKAGVGHIEVAEICTASNTHEWFSHRAEQGKTGRFGAVIVLD